MSIFSRKWADTAGVNLTVIGMVGARFAHPRGLLRRGDPKLLRTTPVSHRVHASIANSTGDRRYVVGLGGALLDYRLQGLAEFVPSQGVEGGIPACSGRLVTT